MLAAARKRTGRLLSAYALTSVSSIGFITVLFALLLVFYPLIDATNAFSSPVLEKKVFACLRARTRVHFLSTT